MFRDVEAQLLIVTPTHTYTQRLVTRRVHGGEVHLTRALLEGVAVHLRKLAALGAADVVEHHQHVALAVQHAVRILRRHDDLRVTRTPLEYRARRLDSLELVQDVEASHQRGVVVVHHVHLRHGVEGAVDAVIHNLGAVGHNLYVTHVPIPHVLHHQVVDRAVRVLLALLLHTLHNLATLALARLRLTPSLSTHVSEALRQLVQRLVATEVLVQPAVDHAVRAQ